MVKFILKKLILIILQKYREKKIANLISKEILKLTSEKKIYTVLDYGSGMQPDTILFIQENLKKSKFIFFFECYDFYNDKQLSQLNKINNNISFFDLSNFPNSKKYDFSLVLDVLHHIDMKNYDIHNQILQKLKNYSHYIFIKDHFQFGTLSNITLRFMDFIGNYYNNVYLPNKYFTENEFNNLINKLSFNEIKRIDNIYYYKKFWLFFSNPKLHFLSILKEKI